MAVDEVRISEVLGREKGDPFPYRPGEEVDEDEDQEEAACGRSVDLGDIHGNVWNEEANDSVPWKDNEGKGANENADRERRRGKERKKEKLEEGGRV